MIELARTSDIVKSSAMEAILRQGGLQTYVFDRAAGSLWQAAIPLRLMIDAGDEAQARRLLWDGGFRPGGDGEWDLRKDVVLGDDLLDEE